jgi:hypothetical protein
MSFSPAIVLDFAAPHAQSWTLRTRNNNRANNNANRWRARA